MSNVRKVSNSSTLFSKVDGHHRKKHSREGERKRGWLTWKSTFQRSIFNSKDTKTEIWSKNILSPLSEAGKENGERHPLQ